MLSVKSILAELKEDLEEQLPGSTGHINVIRKGFDRPAFLVELEKMTMDDATARAVERSATARITIFEPVDAYSDAQVEVLAEKLSALMAHFSGRVLCVGDRYLDIGACAGDYYNDYAELTFPLTWQDDRELHEPEYQPATEIDLTVEVNR